MTKIPAVAIASALVLVCHAANALDCVRPIRSVFTGSDPNRIYVSYTDGFFPAGMLFADAENNEQIVNRTLAVIMAGKLTGNPVVFRYAGGQDGSAASCTPAVTQRLIGAWLQ